ncbi:30S ribosomal protein S3 [Candidatus Woesearchaeota archaeon]|nr:30S ribosomal protein S3 [Candidatus Woesearchaeota archaeon]
MIERDFVKQNIKEMEIQEFISKNLKRAGHSHTKVQRTPLGEKIIIFTSHPGLVVGRKGQNIKKLTADLKRHFNLENPQIETSEVSNMYLDADIIAESIATSLEKFGSNRFKGIGHKMMTSVLEAGARGIEIVISGKIPSSRAKSWRFYAGYLKKCGDISISGVNHAYSRAELKTGTIGIKVSIMPPDLKLPDHFRFLDEAEFVEEEMTDEKKPESEKKDDAKKKSQKRSRKSSRPKDDRAGKSRKREAKPVREEKADDAGMSDLSAPEVHDEG